MTLQHNIHREPPQDATQDYPQSGRAKQVFRVCPAASGLSSLRREGGASSLVGWQEFADEDVSLVPGRLGAAFELAAGGGGLLHHLGPRACRGATRRLLGSGASGAEGRGVDWRGRGAMAAWPQVPDVGVPDRCRLQAVVVDRPGAARGELAEVL